MINFLPLAIGAGVGLLKSAIVDGPRAARQRKLAADTQRLSPWTGLKANDVQEVDPVGSALSFGATGAQLGTGLENAAAQTDLTQAQAKWFNQAGGPSLNNPWLNPFTQPMNRMPSLGNYKL
jgi:hypothetical protein